jgi:hypothetical protein
MESVNKRYTLDDIRTVNIALSELCNMTCSYCPQSLPGVFSKKKKFFPNDLYLKIVDYLPNLRNLEYVCLTDFNDFFLTQGLTEFYLPALKERKLDYLVATNGSIVPSGLPYYKSHNPKYLVIGLQTITEKQYKATSRLKNVSFDSYIEKVSNLIKFFFENCHDTTISIEVAYNVTSSLAYKLVGTSFNSGIPSLQEQQANIASLVEVISEKTGLQFQDGAGDITRYSDQQVLAHTSCGRVFFGAKIFGDIVGLYDKIPTDKPPICFMEGAVFNMSGDVGACCIDYKKETIFENIMDATMESVFEQYVALVNTMRTNGSPFACCRSCFGFKTQREKYAKAAKKIWLQKA